MPGFSRRSFLVAGVAAAVANAGPVYFAEIGQLRAGQRAGGMLLMEALKLRRSTRLYSDKAVAPETLSDLFWVAFGINRPEIS